MEPGKPIEPIEPAMRMRLCRYTHEDIDLPVQPARAPTAPDSVARGVDGRAARRASRRRHRPHAAARTWRPVRRHLIAVDDTRRANVARQWTVAHRSQANRPRADALARACHGRVALSWRRHRRQRDDVLDPERLYQR